MKNERETKRIPLLLVERTVGIRTVGYMCIAITWWLLGMLMAGWFSAPDIPGIAFGSLYALGSILLPVMGILSIVYKGDVFDNVIFLGMGGLLFSFHVGHIAGILGEPNFSGYYGWFALLWAIYFCYLWIASIIHVSARGKSNIIRMLFLLFFWVGALIAAIGGWSDSHGLAMLSGYLFLLSSIMAFIISAIAIFVGIKERSIEESSPLTPPPPYDL